MSATRRYADSVKAPDAARLRLTVPAPPPATGRLLDAGEVAATVFSGKVTPRWVREHLQAGRGKLGRRVVWDEDLVRQWRATQFREN